jgi:hypothetical protein
MNKKGKNKMKDGNELTETIPATEVTDKKKNKVVKEETEFVKNEDVAVNLATFAAHASLNEFQKIRLQIKADEENIKDLTIPEWEKVFKTI